MSVETVARLTGLLMPAIRGFERGEDQPGLSLDDMIGLALFLGLTAVGTPRDKPKGAV